MIIYATKQLQHAPEMLVIISPYLGRTSHHFMKISLKILKTYPSFQCKKAGIQIFHMGPQAPSFHEGNGKGHPKIAAFWGTSLRRWSRSCELLSWCLSRMGKSPCSNNPDVPRAHNKLLIEILRYLLSNGTFQFLQSLLFLRQICFFATSQCLHMVILSSPSPESSMVAWWAPRPSRSMLSFPSKLACALQSVPYSLTFRIKFQTVTHLLPELLFFM